MVLTSLPTYNYKAFQFYRILPYLEERPTSIPRALSPSIGADVELCGYECTVQLLRVQNIYDVTSQQMEA